jgi:nicotinate phosphoribosyltransferase
MSTDLFAAKRSAMRDDFFQKLFLLGGWLGGTDTYKRTMWAAVPEIALQRASYSLTFRKPLPEPGAGSQLIMAGHEAMLAQWFHRPLLRSDIELASRWFSEHTNTTAFPHELWQSLLASQQGEEIRLPIDVWGFAGGQTFLAGVPCLVFEGPGGIVSYIEPAMCRYFAPVIQATKARLMKEVTSRDAEFGLRSAPVEICNIILLLARYVGGGGQLTSNDTAEFMYPELFRSIGTIGHEMMCAGQTFDNSLSAAEYEMMERYVSRMGSASLLCDLVDAETVGLENALRVIKNHPQSTTVGIRVDSGDIASQCVLYYQKMQQMGIQPRQIVFEDEVRPETVREVYDTFRKLTGQEPTMLFPGAGGYWWRLVHRDTLSAAFKRTATGGSPNIKFSNSPGKESLPGYLRVYAQGDSLVVAEEGEVIDGQPLFVKLVDQGRIVYTESFQDQASRASSTWGQYKSWILSPRVSEYINRFRAMRAEEISVARSRLSSS